MAKAQNGHPYDRPSIRGNTSAMMEALTRTMPPKSWVRPGCGGVAGTSRQAAMTANMPMGMLTRKIGRQSRP